MAKLLHLASWFLAGIALTTIGVWLLQFPAFASAISTLNAAILVAWVCCWLFDDALIQLFKIDKQLYYTVLMGSAIVAILAGVVACLAYLVRQY